MSRREDHQSARARLRERQHEIKRVFRFRVRIGFGVVFRSAPKTIVAGIRVIDQSFGVDHNNDLWPAEDEECSTLPSLSKAEGARVMRTTEARTPMPPVLLACSSIRKPYYACLEESQM